MLSLIITFKMQSRIDKQQKLYYKNKVSDIINSYQKQKEEEEKQKIQIKKQIMMSIMNNRQKSQTEATNKQKSQTSKIEKTQKTNLSEQAVFDLNTQDNKVLLKSNMYQPQLNLDTKYQSQLSKKPEHLEDITFNAKKRNKSLEQEPSFKESYLNMLKERRQKEQQEQYNNKMKESMKNRFQPKSYSQIQKSIYKSSNQHQQEPEEEYRKEEQQSYYPNFAKYSQIKESLPYAKSKTQISNHSKEQEYESSERSEEKKQSERQEEQKGVFLTMMGESQSMVAEQPPKNITFQIKMDKSVNPDGFQQLKRLKIKEMQRKRQQRIQQFRRNQSQKKVQMPKGKNSYSKRPEKQQINQSQLPPPPRSATVQRKSNNSVNPSKIEIKHDKEPINKNLIPLESHQSHYNLKPKNPKPIPSSNSYHNEPEQKPSSYKQIYANNYDQKEIKPKSPFKTPKSIMSQNNRGKSNNKNTNIFTVQNEPQRQKSNNKYAQPKIEPKDRKNSFTRQSNKKLMINAITHVIFPGQLNRKERQRLIDIIQASQYQFFIFLFKEYSRKMIKGIYVFDSTQVYLRKIYGQKSPSEITADMVQQFYRFDSGSRQFKKVDGCKSFSLSIHAIDLRK